MKINKPVSKGEKISGLHLAGIFIISMSALLLEFTMTRILSVSLWYNFAFMIISIALLGFGISGVILSLVNKLRTTPINLTLTVLSLIYGISVIFSFWLLNKIPFDPFSLFIDSTQFVYMPIYYLLITIPFFFAGLIISILISRFQEKITKLYFFDLLGAGLSCFLFVIFIPLVGGNGTVIVVAIMGFIGAIFFNGKKNIVYSVSSLILIGVSVTLFFNKEEKIPISISPNKEFFNLAKQRPDLVLLSEWNTFSKIDVMIDEDEPVDGYKLYIAVIDDGNANANIPSLKSLPPLQKPADASNLAFVNKDSCNNVYIIGSSGGGEILTSLYHNAKNITGVEINGIFNDLISNKLAYWTGALVRNNKVTLVTDDARSYLQSTNNNFDVILSAHTISASALSSGAMSMVENFILTKEAISEYINKLNSGGILYISRPEIQLPKLAATLREADGTETNVFKKKIILFKRIGKSGTIEEQSSYLAGAIYKKNGFSEIDLLNIRNDALKLGIEIIYDFNGSRNETLKTIIENPDLTSVINSSPTLIKPATDDKPFFDNNFGFGKLNLTDVLNVFSQDKSVLLSLKEKPVAEATLLSLLLQVIFIAGIFLILPFILLKKKFNTISNKKYSLYFALIGLGYITIQIVLMQRFTLFLGHPVFTMLAVISTMLVSSGFGSLFTRKFYKDSKSLYVIFGIIFVLILVVGLVFPPILFTGVYFPISIKIIFTVVIIFPLGFFMGMPFPLGILHIKKDENIFISFCWAINGFFSVTGSVLTIILSMISGFKLIFIIAAVIYAFAFILIYQKSKIINILKQ